MEPLPPTPFLKASRLQSDERDSKAKLLPPSSPSTGSFRQQHSLGFEPGSSELQNIPNARGGFAAPGGARWRIEAVGGEHTTPCSSDQLEKEKTKESPHISPWQNALSWQGLSLRSLSTNVPLPGRPHSVCLLFLAGSSELLAGY